ncbi:MAG: SDR family NAD(P)-dependent oxidoreductase [Proteobacteria bacterium]|nr:SDR family NAD(P)-dependent oxidoreductase [Pseudomonadota bacterium]
MNKLNNKTIFLTGACGGLGSALALELCKQQADVIISDKNPRSLNIMCDKIVEQGGKEPLVYPMDLVGATPNDFIVLAKTIEENLGKLDVLIHTAVEFSGLTEFAHYAATRWLKEMQINLNSPIFLTQALIPLLKQSVGKIIFTLDDLEVTSKAYWGAYGTCKSARAHFASTLKLELESAQVDVYSITPPPMRTHLRSKAWSGEDDSHLLAPQQVLKQYIKLL